ncbi:MAG TPA: hypothetical protein VKS79_01080 [Gemmataceae bacterium]|nr:hypothetical protein [Gemmataceae bacterium]
MEAKKPAVRLKDNADAAYQLRCYAWNGKLPLSILTNFEELAVYDCRIRPRNGDKASVARTLYLSLREYAERWNEIADVFSKEAIKKGSFDKYADTAKKKRGTAPVDAALLDDIEKWRLDLAKNLALRNPKLDQRELNFAVQMTIDRIVFLRLCEDRGIEDYGQLRDLCEGEDIYDRLKTLFRKADDRYNSGLFYFKADKEHGDDKPDEITPKLQIEDKLLKNTIDELYPPQSQYDFSVLPVEILGQVYEQFLGKVIRLTAGHRAIRWKTSRR